MKRLTRDKVRVVFLLVASGDALGMPVETWSREKIEVTFGKIDTYHPPPAEHPWLAGEPAGTWTDDTALTLAVARALIELKAFNMQEIADEHVKVLLENPDVLYGSTKSAVERLEQGMKWFWSGQTDHPKQGKGNGVAMKIAPLALYFATQGYSYRDIGNKWIVPKIKDFAHMTHKTDMGFASGMAQVAAILFALSVSDNVFDGQQFLREAERAAWHAEKSVEGDTLSKRLLFMKASWTNLLDRLDDPVRIRGIVGTGGALAYESVPVALYLFAKNPNSIDCVYNAASYGKDTDTIAAMVGALLGAHMGTKVIPQHLIDGLQESDEILRVADEFCDTFNIKD